MASVNKTISVGHLGKDCELRHITSGKAVAKFSLGMSESWMDNGEKKEKTEWMDISVWGTQAENCAKYLGKGSLVYVEGSLHTRSYDDKDGNKRYKTEIEAKRIQFLNLKPPQGNSPNEDSFGNVPDAFDDEVPF